MTRVSTHPFEYDDGVSSTRLQTVKMVLLGVVLVPLRVVWLLLSVLLMFITCKAVVVHRKHFGNMFDKDGKEVPRQYPIASHLVKLYCRMMIIGFGYWWVPVTYEEGTSRDVVQDASMIVSTHASFAEGLFVAWLVGAGMVVGRAETVLDNPILSAFAGAGQAIAVRRENEESRKAAADEIRRRARWNYDQPKEVIEKEGRWPTMLIFPEGTTTNSTALIEFKAGAFLPGVPVQPIVFKHPYMYVDPTWSGAVRGRVVSIKLMSQLYNTMEVIVMKPIEPTKAEIADPQLFAKRVQRKMAEVAGVPITKHSMEDMALAVHCSKRKLPMCALEKIVNVDVGAKMTKAERPTSAAKELIKEVLDAYAKEPTPPRAEWDLGTGATREGIARAVALRVDAAVKKHNTTTKA